jgi:hypothetical protein
VDASILRKLEDEWEQIIKIHVYKYEGRPLCDLGAIFCLSLQVQKKMDPWHFSLHLPDPIIKKYINGFYFLVKWYGVQENLVFINFYYILVIVCNPFFLPLFWKYPFKEQQNL